jgi:hypothetical protein
MPAYARLTVTGLLNASTETLVGQLETSYARDGYASLFAQQTLAWATVIPLLQQELRSLVGSTPTASEWTVLLEYPLYRLRKRIDIVLLAHTVVVVIEAKVGEQCYRKEDERQVEEYALDLRDFHAASRSCAIVPVLWCTEASSPGIPDCPVSNQVAPVQKAGRGGLASLLSQVRSADGQSPLCGQVWDNSPYRPVPNVIEAATSIFAGHSVRSIAQADASNLREAAARIIKILLDAKRHGRRVVVLLTGVPGSGKTLAGLHVVHDSIASGAEEKGDIVYLSGNTPLVTVLREALARDEYKRARMADPDRRLKAIRRDVRARIQHINDFLKQSLNANDGSPPHEHAIVFDEAQRAWDVQQGRKKFSREASEPSLLLELMGRHQNWCGLVCLVGGGQEINSGEQGLAGWGDALRKLAPSIASGWEIHLPADAVSGGPSANGLSLGELPATVAIHVEPDLQLYVPLRTYRCPAVSEWVRLVLDGKAAEAATMATSVTSYPIVITRSLEAAKEWLRSCGRGERRFGLVASSGARRLRADGLGVLLSADDRDETAHWYLDPLGDIRSSCALEVPANQYTCQGLELDFIGICWGGDFLRSKESDRWVCRTLAGHNWNLVRGVAKQQFIQNSYRVLLTRAREGMVIWVPRGTDEDDTRDPFTLDATAAFLESCGARPL